VPLTDNNNLTNTFVPSAPFDQNMPSAPFNPNALPPVANGVANDLRKCS
jgi:hypothetical protein